MAVNPLITNNFIDSCAFDPKYEPEASASLEIFELSEKDHFLLQIAHSTQKEVAHPNTSLWVRQQAGGLIFSVNVQLTDNERQVLADIEAILAGNGKIENIQQDARHVFEAQKYGSYFITTDNRILSRAQALRHRCTITVLKPSEFLALVKQQISAGGHA